MTKDNPFAPGFPDKDFIISAMLMPSKKKLGKIAYHGLGGHAGRIAHRMGKDLMEQFNADRYEVSHG